MRAAVACCLASLLVVLTACSAYAPPADSMGKSGDQIISQMGPPETRRTLDGGGTRLEFPRGPAGVHTWFVTLDAAGRVVRSEQVLTERNFLQVNPGMPQDEVRYLLGRPGEVSVLGRSRGVVWSYRYENSSCLWFQVEIAQDRTVRSAGYGEPPECRGPDASAFE
jgi:hypothetical protein